MIRGSGPGSGSAFTPGDDWGRTPPTAGSGALNSTERDVTLQLSQPRGTDSRQRRPKGKGSAAGKNRWLVDPNKLIKARPLSREEEEKDEEEEEEEGGREGREGANAPFKEGKKANKDLKPLRLLRVGANVKSILADFFLFER